ncbi:hypothetical protein C8Q76DRAFT_801137 [Earliella scabrosa]|nr:hypothetical protein C8Q76DRAFT_801137 [Earliella scabrosa]
MSKNLAFTTDSPFSGAVVDTATGDTLYEIAREIGERGKSHPDSVLSIRDVRRGEVVATWERAYDRHRDRVTVDGQTRPLGEWLLQKDALSPSTLYLVTPDGEEYVWKQSARPKSTFELVHTKTQRTIAKSRPGHLALHYLKPFGTPCPKTLSLDLEPEAVAMSDTVLLSFAILEGSRQEQRMANTTYRWTGHGGDAGRTTVPAGP